MDKWGCQDANQATGCERFNSQKAQISKSKDLNGVGQPHQKNQTQRWRYTSAVQARYPYV